MSATTPMNGPLGARQGPDWRQVGLAVGRCVIVLGTLLALYFVVPVQGFASDVPLAAVLRLGAVGVAFLALLLVELRIVASARAPLLRAAEAVIEGIAAFICLFALLHLSLSTSDAQAFTEPLSRLDALYFTSTTLATVGFGDIVPTQQLSRTVVTVQVLAGFGLLFVVAKAAFHVARRPGQKH